MREKLIELLGKATSACVGTDCFEGCKYYAENDCRYKLMADVLIAHGVTVQECTHKCWDVCNNNGNIQYRCPHCETVYVYMYKNHIAPDVCRECGARLYLPQPPKGE